MKERPILFSAPMVRAILAGTKTQTRRVVKMDRWRLADGGEEFAPATIGCPYGQPGDRLWVRESWGVADKWLHDCETDPPRCIAYRADLAARNFDPVYDVDTSGWAFAPRMKWRPSIHMPRWASRITLEVTGVRVERLQDISEADAIAEGIAELVPPEMRREGLTPAALAFAAAATVDAMPRTSRRGFLAGALAASLGFVASPSRPWEVLPGRVERAPKAQQLYALLWESINGPGSWGANSWVWVIDFRRA